MFYPVDSLRRGGKFYLCWLADSWPVRFDSIPKRVLWSTDIRKLCDELMNVVTRESGFASTRFSLRLTSQLLRGLVRIYDRKAKLLLGDVLLIDSTVTKYLHRKYHLNEPKPKRRPRNIQVIDIVELPLENEERLAERIQNSGNVVANLDDITLREAPLPQIQLPTDGFGEENPEQALALLQDRTLEYMLAASGSGVRVSTYEVDTSDLAQDPTRAPPHSHVMDVISELDNTIFNKTAHEKRMTFDENELEKEIPQIPDPELLIPEPVLPNPQSELPNPVSELPNPVSELPNPQSNVQIPLETLPHHPVTREEPQLLLEIICQIDYPEPYQQPVKQALRIEYTENIETVGYGEGIQTELGREKEWYYPFTSLEEVQRIRRRKRKLAVDRVIIIPSDQIRARIQDVNVEKRCQTARDELISLEVPVGIYFLRPVHAGHRFHCNISPKLLRNFQRNLGSSSRNMEDDEVNGAYKVRFTCKAFSVDVSVRDLLQEIRVTLRPRHARDGTENEPTTAQQQTEAQQPPEAPLQTEAEEPTDISYQKGNITDIQKSITRVIENVKEMEAMANKMPIITSTEPETTTEVDTTTTGDKAVCAEKEVEKCGYEPMLQETAVLAVPHEEEDIMMVPAQKQQTQQPKRLRIGSRDSDKENELIVSKRRRNSKSGLRVGVKELNISPENIQDNVTNTFMVQEPPVQESTLEIPWPVQGDVEERSVSQVLRESGIADNRELSDKIPSEIRVMSSRRGRDVESDCETPLGSLDRTEVDLGSDVTTESNRKIKNEWGVHGTMLKILKLERRLNRPFTFDELISSGPMIQGKNPIVAASCFSSLLKLKQHGLVILTKTHPSLGIDKIRCGEKFLRILN